MQGEILACQEEQAFQKNYMKVVDNKLLRVGMVPARTWRTCFCSRPQETIGRIEGVYLAGPGFGVAAQKDEARLD